MENNPSTFSIDVSVYGNLEPYNNTISKARLRTFYKYFNRNGTYITDEFAEKLISSAPYAPVKGIYDNFDEDFTDHGAKRELGRIYGIVPENPNFAWEKHLDKDGVEREYACFDVLLFTALYKEANQIVGKSQSMELYEPSLKYEYRFIEGKKTLVFTEGCFLGLQVLGEGIEPCFEDAAFYTLYDNITNYIKKLEEYNLNSRKGGKRMPNINFKLSDGQKCRMLSDLLNPNCNEAGDWEVDYVITDVYDNYAVVYNYQVGGFERVYYTKDDKTDSLSIGNKEKCFIVDVNETERDALETIQALNGGTYEKINENFTQNAKVEEKISEYEQKIEEKNNTISTLTTERDTAQTNYAQIQAEKDSLNQELNTLKEYKLGVEKQEKETILNKYSDKLSEEVISKYAEKILEYTIVDLEKDLAFELVKSNPTIFTANTGNRIPKPEQRSGIEAILDKYRK